MDEQQDRISEQEVIREKKVHGAFWSRIYGGYFQSEEYARPLLDAADAVIQEHQPDAVVDLGGGTGFIIKTLAKDCAEGSARRWVDMDLSQEQLSQVADERITTVCGSMLDFDRCSFVLPEEEVLYLTRSTIHYVGMAGQRRLLRHIRSQMNPGEFFIVQAAAFENSEDALCLSELFERMQTEKWLIPLDSLKNLMVENGFVIDRIIQAPPLVMH
ncbi:MAG: class I SAM-dependent methyltransferase, partial [Kiritimatiellae bacterium]|nr:class I SAM-dependent methyltransferase [Kiritimatiellia bacterium]